MGTRPRGGCWLELEEVSRNLRIFDILRSVEFRG